MGLHAAIIGLRFRMRTLVILSAALGLLLLGCATLSQADRDVLQQHRISPALYSKMAHGERLSLPDIIELSEKHLSAPFIGRYLRSSLAVYRLNSDDVVVLRKAGVSPQVIDYLMATPGLYAPRYDPFWYGYDPFWDVGYDGVVVLNSHGHHHHHHR
jgi:hypothetical protein